MTLTAVVAADEANVIGVDGDLPWRLPNDLKHFKAITLGHPVLMGRKTYESIGRPLPGRLNLVLTRQPGWRADGITTVNHLDEALAQSGLANSLMVIGGGEIYRMLWPRIQVIELTRVHTRIEGDTHFPAFDEPDWVRRTTERHAADDRHAFEYSFERWERVSSG